MKKFWLLISSLFVLVTPGNSEEFLNSVTILKKENEILKKQNEAYSQYFTRSIRMSGEFFRPFQINGKSMGAGFFPFNERRASEGVSPRAKSQFTWASILSWGGITAIYIGPFIGITQSTSYDPNNNYYSNDKYDYVIMASMVGGLVSVVTGAFLRIAAMNNYDDDLKKK